MPDRTTAPPALAIRKPSFPVLAKHELSNGINVNIHNELLQELCLLELIVPIGKHEEDIPGINHYLFKLISEGTPTMNSEQIADAFEYCGGHLEIVPMLDYVSIKLYSLNRFFPRLVKLLAQLLSEANYPEAELDTAKQIRLQQYRQNMSRNQTLASIKFRECLFGESHPYGSVVSEDDILNVKREDLLSRKGRLLAEPYILITGSVNDAILNALEESIGQLPVHSPDRTHPTSIHACPEKIIDRSGNQASIRLGSTSIDRRHKDIHCLKITNELFGGFFGSRLMKNIREEKGLTYGIHSSISHLQHASYFSISSEVLKEKSELVLEEIIKEAQHLQAKPPGEAEFRKLISYLKGKFLISNDSVFTTHTTIKNLHLAELGFDYLMAYYEHLDTITPEDISLMANRYIQPGQFVKVIVS